MLKIKSFSNLFAKLALTVIICCCLLLPFGGKQQTASAESSSTTGTDGTTSAYPLYIISDVYIDSTYTKHYELSLRVYHVMGGTTTIISDALYLTMPSSGNTKYDMAVIAELPSKLTDAASYSSKSIVISEGYQTGYYCIEIDWQFASIWYQVIEKSSADSETNLAYIGASSDVPYKVTDGYQPEASVYFYSTYTATKASAIYSLSTFS